MRASSWACWNCANSAPLGEKMRQCRLNPQPLPVKFDWWCGQFTETPPADLPVVYGDDPFTMGDWVSQSYVTEIADRPRARRMTPSEKSRTPSSTAARPQ